MESPSMCFFTFKSLFNPHDKILSDAKFLKAQSAGLCDVHKHSFCLNQLHVNAVQTILFKIQACLKRRKA